MKKNCQRLITTCLLISSFIFFCGINGCEQISGTVHGDVQKNVTLTLSGNLTDTTTTLSDGSYSFGSLTNGNYTITPIRKGYIFDPASQNITVPGDTTGVDFTATATAEVLNIIESINSNMVSIPGGTFLMGCTPEDTECDSDELPQHSVTISPFEISKYEVTQYQWEAVMGSNPSEFDSCGDNCPVDTVSWNDIQVFIEELNDLTGSSYRLPSEAEWEYAARAETTTTWWCGNNVTCLDDIAWYTENSGSITEGSHPVGQKNPNLWGLCDMTGNVWEWVNDFYDYDYYSSDNATDPTGPASGSLNVIRGGSWYSLAEECRSSNRINYNPEALWNNFGFRLAR